MSKYDYLINTHDLETLTDWGPFARDIYALSHIADRKKGVKFDFCLKMSISAPTVFWSIFGLQLCHVHTYHEYRAERKSLCVKENQLVIIERS